MDKILDEIKSIPGIIGGFIYSSQKGISASNLPAVFKQDRLQTIAKMLIKIYSSGVTCFPDMLEISIYYDESILIIREISASTYLIIVCDPSINENFLAMSLNLIVSDLKKAAITQKEQNNIEQAFVAAKSGKNIPDKNIIDKNIIDGEQLLNQGPISENLKNMQTALAKIAGPMAKIIFIDALNEWVKTSRPSLSSINVLINILEAEINDPEKMDYYRELVSPYIK
ncbi:Uncharacterized protein dnl_63520 [Desulfonema limicola]|uniref:DUF8082 domain-containing protein n=1 Tax=Desulfonema limicola TaxID=45656 RepID=A0A975BEI6_9BACT|nr:hypothetical protein [Desulfonema limicola]QTA83927.1 Uncharacterized protein dnl_63520 [Desulfonema limicola]